MSATYAPLPAFRNTNLHITFSAQPSITGFSPASGSVGSTVTINGNNFSATPAGNIVYFGAVKAIVYGC